MFRGRLGEDTVDDDHWDRRRVEDEKAEEEEDEDKKTTLRGRKGRIVWLNQPED